MHSEVVTSRIITVIILFNIQLAPDFVGCWAQPQAEAPLAPHLPAWEGHCAPCPPHPRPGIHQSGLWDFRSNVPFVHGLLCLSSHQPFI